MAPAAGELPARPNHEVVEMLVPSACLFSSVFDTKTATTLCASQRFYYLPRMPTETTVVDAEDLKSRVRELRRFL